MSDLKLPELPEVEYWRRKLARYNFGIMADSGDVLNSRMTYGLLCECQRMLMDIAFQKIPCDSSESRNTVHSESRNTVEHPLHVSPPYSSSFRPMPEISYHNYGASGVLAEDVPLNRV